MSVLQKSLAGLVIASIAFVGIGLLLPPRVHVERSVLIDARPASLFALVNGFRTLPRWSVWAERDPETVFTYEGPDQGVGARINWVSHDPAIGTGSREIVASESNRRVEIDVDVGGRPAVKTYFELSPGPDGVLTTLGLDAEFGWNLVQRYQGLMLDRWVGADFEASLLRLEAVAESLPKADWTGLEIDLVDVAPVNVLSSMSTAAPDLDAIDAMWKEAGRAIRRFMAAEDLTETAAPVVDSGGKDGEEWRFEVGLPVSPEVELELPNESPIQLHRHPGGPAARAVGVGRIADVTEYWQKLEAWAAAHGYRSSHRRWLELVSDPSQTAAADRITHFYLAVE